MREDQAKQIRIYNNEPNAIFTWNLQCNMSFAILNGFVWSNLFTTGSAFWLFEMLVTVHRCSFLSHMYNVQCTHTANRTRVYTRADFI